MTTLDLLWLPVILSSLVVFFASAVINMAPLWHKNDFPKLKDQDSIIDALRPFNIAPGEYLVPRANATERKSPEFQEKLKTHPVMIMTVWKYGTVPMGATFLFWFLYTTVMSLFAAYIAGRALPPGSEYLSVFRFTGAAAFLGYSAAVWQFTIWYSRPWKSSLKMTFDGLIYACLTAGMFGWLWPV